MGSFEWDDKNATNRQKHGISFEEAEPIGRLLRIADLIDGDSMTRDRVIRALKDPSQKHNRDHVDIIIALGGQGGLRMGVVRARAHGRLPRQPDRGSADHRPCHPRRAGQTRTRFANLIAEPDAAEQAVTEAVTDTLKAITAKAATIRRGNASVSTSRAAKPSMGRGLFDEELVPQELTQVRLGKIIREKYPELDAEDHEAVRQHAIAAMTLTQQAKKIAVDDAESDKPGNTALIDGVRKFAMDVRELDIDLIDSINPFGEAYAILAKTMNEESLRQVAAVIAGNRTTVTPEDAKDLAIRAFRFKKERGRVPSLTAADAWERRMAEGAAAFMRFKREGRYA